MPVNTFFLLMRGNKKMVANSNRESMGSANQFLWIKPTKYIAQPQTETNIQETFICRHIFWKSQWADKDHIIYDDDDTNWNVILWYWPEKKHTKSEVEQWKMSFCLPLKHPVYFPSLNSPSQFPYIIISAIKFLVIFISANY